MFAFTRSWEGSRVSYLAVAKPWKWLEHQKLRPSWARWPQPWRWGCADRCTSARCPQTRWADPWCRSWRWQRPPTGYMGKFLLKFISQKLKKGHEKWIQTFLHSYLVIDGVKLGENNAIDKPGFVSLGMISQGLIKFNLQRKCRKHPRITGWMWALQTWNICYEGQDWFLAAISHIQMDTQ